MTKRFMPSCKRLLFACGAAMVMALSTPAISHAEWAYTARAYGNSSAPVSNWYGCYLPHFGTFTCFTNGEVINWTLEALVRAAGAMYSDSKPTFEIAVKVKCVNTTVSPWQYKWKNQPDGIQQYVSYVCPVGRDASWSEGALTDPASY